MSQIIRIDPVFRIAIENIRKRAEIDYKLKYKTERKFSDPEVTKIIGIKVIQENYGRIPIEKVMLIINGHKMRGR